MVLVAWVFVMAALYREIHPTVELARPHPPRVAGAVERWQGIYSEGRKIGWARRSRWPIGDGFRLETEAHMQLAMMGVPRRVDTEITADTDPRLELRTFEFHLRAGSVDFTVRGKATPQGLELDSSALGGRPVRLPLGSPVVLSETLQESLGQERLEEGKILHYALLDPLTATPAKVTLRVGALEHLELDDGLHSAYVVTEEFHGSTFRLWVTPEGEVLKEEGPLGVTLVRESATKARSGEWKSGPGLDLTTAAAIPSARAIPSPRTLGRLDLRIEGVPSSQTISFPPRQVLEGGHLRIRRESADDLVSFRLPQTDARFADDLASTPFLQSDDPRLRRQAEEILGDERDAHRAAEKLLGWVSETLAKVPTLSVPSALDVLDARQGDCNEHAVLFTALARAAGLPARVVAGTVYMPGDGDSPGAFYYHAWSEVWLGEWTAADPTFGQLPADATHVKLLEGGPETHAALVSVLGKLRLEVVDFG